MVDGLVFSKDRPAQLDLLLRSIAAHAPELYSSLWVLWDASSPAYEEAYRVVLEEGRENGLRWIREAPGSFRGDVLGWLDWAGELVGFLVDDLVFYRDVPRGRLYDSYRLGLNCIGCYPQNRAQVVPAQGIRSGRGFEWRLERGAGDFGYPLSLDAHVYKKENILPLLEFDFYDPNSLEAGLDARSDAYPPERLTCPPHSCAVSIPANLVNRTVANRHGINPAERPQALNERFLAGGRLSLEAVESHTIIGAHQEIPLEWQEA